MTKFVFNPGDLVLKEGRFEAGAIGIVIRTFSLTASGEQMLSVLSDGKLTKWYAGKVRTVNEKA